TRRDCWGQSMWAAVLSSQNDPAVGVPGRGAVRASQRISRTAFSWVWPSIWATTVGWWAQYSSSSVWVVAGLAARDPKWTGASVGSVDGWRVVISVWWPKVT